MRKKKFLEVLYSSFNQCFFVSLLILSSYAQSLAGIKNIGVILPILNGVISVLIMFILNIFLAKKRYLTIYSIHNSKSLLVVAFIAGVLSVYMATIPLGTYLITSFIFYLTLKSIKSFSKKMVNLLQVNKIAEVHDVVEFFDFFVNLILTFTVINLSIYVANHSLGITLGFNFGQGIGGIIDSLYFTVVTMTTVGFGDILAQSNFAKIVVVIECLTSYIMFGLMIGIISRGVSFNKK